MRVLAWVAAEIGADLYAGVMRGAQGCFAARAGNAADKAVLLREMLRAADPGSELRFATCTLPAEQAEQMVDAALSYQPVRPTLLVEVASDAAQQAKDPKARAILERTGKSWQALVEEARAESDHLAKTLEASGIKLGSPARDSLRALVSRHIWLQRRHDSDWIDFDPTLKDAKPGSARCKAESTLAELPPEEYHRLTVKVKIEERENGTVRMRYVLDKAWPIADLAETPLTLMHAEPLGLGKLLPSGPEAPEGSLNYTPILQVGDRYELGQPYFLPRPASAPRGGSMKSIGKALGGLTGALDALSTDTEKPTEAPSKPSGPEVTAAWLEAIITGPDGKPKTHAKTIESTIFDRIGYAARSMGNAASAPLAPLPEENGEYLPLATLWNIATWTGQTISEVEQAGASEDVAGLAKSLGQMHQSYYEVRRALFDRTQSSPRRVITMRPGVSLLGWTPMAGRDASLLIDLISNASVPGSSSSGATAGPAWGVSSVLAERFLVGLDSISSADMPLPGADAVSVFSTARKEQAPLEVLKPGDNDKVQTISASPEARARIAADLAAGETVLVPARAVSIGSSPVIGWWLVDADSGTVLDEMENGRHTEMTEYNETNEPAVKAAPRYRSLGQRIMCWANRAVFALSLLGGDPQGAWTAAKAEAKVLKAADDQKKNIEKAGGSKKAGACGGK